MLDEIEIINNLLSHIQYLVDPMRTSDKWDLYNVIAKHLPNGTQWYFDEIRHRWEVLS